MLKNITLAVIAVLFVGTAAKANDDLLDQIAGMDLSQINETVSEVDDLDLAGLDMDELASQAGEAVGDETDAIEACFRRFGYRGGGWRGGWGGGNRGYRGFSATYRGYNRCYSSYYRHSCHRPLYCYRPVTVNYCAPVRHVYSAPICQTLCTPTVFAPICNSYWGCH